MITLNHCRARATHRASFFFQAEDGIRDTSVTGVQTCALPIFNGVITGLSIGVLLWLIGVQPALMFGVFAFLGEFLPNIGAFLVAIPILLIALSLGATKFWLALGVIVLVYQVELNVLVPGVLGKEMRLHPVNILFFTLATATVFGLLGVFLAVPAAALVQIVIDEFYLQAPKPNYDALDREAAALVEGKK